MARKDSHIQRDTHRDKSAQIAQVAVPVHAIVVTTNRIPGKQFDFPHMIERRGNNSSVSSVKYSRAIKQGRHRYTK
jgi:hypothetical protein